METQNFINSLLVSEQNSLGVLDIVFSISIPFVLVCFIALFYKHVVTRNNYSENFVYSLFIFASLTSVITLLIGSNIARAFGLVGALSLIRFRTAVKSPMDAIFLFWSLSVGMACGTGFYFAAALIVFLGCLYLGILMKSRFAELKYNNMIAKVTTPIESANSSTIKKELKEVVKKVELLNTFFDTDENKQVFVYSIDARRDQNLIEIQEHCNKITGVESVQLLNSESSLFI
jgi:hypothetical protein